MSIANRIYIREACFEWLIQTCPFLYPAISDGFNKPTTTLEANNSSYHIPFSKSATLDEFSLVSNFFMY